MKQKAFVVLFVSLLLCFGVCGCTGNAGSTDSGSQGSSENSNSAIAEAITNSGETLIKDVKNTTDEIIEEAKPQALNVGDTVQNEQFSITLTDARVDSVLSSNQSSTYWEPATGGAFVILEFDVTALTSEQLPVDDYAITELNAKYNEDVYPSWELQYISSQLWLYFRHTYLDANLPCHVYAYTTVPADALNSGSLSISATLAGQPVSITIR